MDFLTRRNALLAGAGCLAMGVVGCATSGTTTTTVTSDLTQAASVVTALNAAITTFESEAGSAITPAQLTTIQTIQGYIATINSSGILLSQNYPYENAGFNSYGVYEAQPGSWLPEAKDRTVEMVIELAVLETIEYVLPGFDGSE